MNRRISIPVFTVTDGIQQILDDVSRDAWLVDNALLPSQQELWLRRRARVRRSVATTRIEGANLEEADLAALLERGRSGTQLTEDQLANLNASRAYEFVDFLSDQTDLEPNELALRELNRQFLSGFPAKLTPGIYRSGQNYVRLYSSPPHAAVPGLVRELMAWLAEDATVPPVIKAAVVHIHLVAIHPFWDGNGRTARAFSTLLLQRSEFSFKQLLSLESALYAVRDDYFWTLDRVLGRQLTPGYDCSQWLVFFATTLRSESRQLVRWLTSWTRGLQEAERAISGEGISKRQVQAVILAWQQDRLTPAQYGGLTGVSPGTASRDLADLVAKDWLVAEGETRSRVYRLSPSRLSSLPPLDPQSSV